MAWRGSLSRSVMATARSSSPLRSAPPVRPIRTPAAPAAAPRRGHLPFPTPSRTFGELGCVQSLLPLHSVVAAARLTSHLSVSVRACCELCQGTFHCTCQDR